jgi:hypothetical protein
MDIAASNDYLCRERYKLTLAAHFCRKSAVRASNLKKSILVSQRERPIVEGG